MIRIVTAVASAQLLSANFNSLQDKAMGLLAAAGGISNGLNTMTGGVDGLLWQPTANITNGTLVTIDSGDWHDRIVVGAFFGNTSSTYAIGNAADYLLSSASSAAFWFGGYLGKGALSNVTGPVAVTNGNGPCRNSSGGNTSWCVNLAATDVGSGPGSAAGSIALYTDPSTGQLRIYNGTAGTLMPTLFLLATGATGKRP